MARKILCVAEKPSIAKSVAQHLSGGQFNTVRTLSMVQAGGGFNIYIAQYPWQDVREKLRFRFQLQPAMGSMLGDDDQCHWPFDKPRL